MPSSGQPAARRHPNAANGSQAPSDPGSWRATGNSSTTWTLGRGLIHGDAYAENLIHTGDQVVLSDWDSVSHGPREQDIIPASIRHRFGRPKAEWDQFCAAYGVDPHDLPGLAVLRQMRELRTLVPYIRSGQPQAQDEVNRRIADLMSGTQREPWHPLNLAP